MKAKEMAAAVGVGEVTFSRWKKERPELYARIVASFECEERLAALRVSMEDALQIIEAYAKAER